MYRNIVQIKIQNFQSHEYTVIDLDKGVNVIVGKTDSGKSAIIRALRWVFFNEPRGTDYIRTGTDETIVELVYDDGYVVRRIRNKKVNGYEVEFDSNIEQYYGIGSEVPEEIKKITGVRKIKFSESNDSVMINFQNQHDGAFMLNDSPAQKAKSIGYISNVNVIDEAIRRANQYELNAKQEKKRYEQELESNINELKQYDSLDDEIEKLNTIKEKYSLLENKIIERNKLSNLKNNYDEVNKLMSIGREYIEKFSTLDKSIDIYANLNKASYIFNYISELLLQFKNNIASLNECKRILSMYQNLDNYRDIYLSLENKSQKFKLLNKFYSEYSINESQLLNLDNILNDTRNVQSIKERLHDINLVYEKNNVLKTSINNLLAINQKIKEIDSYISEYNFDKIISIQNNIENIKDKHQLLKSLSSQFFSVDSEYKNLNTVYNDLDKNINEMVENYIELIEKENICPLCGSVMDSTHIDKIKKEYNYELWWTNYKYKK